METDKDRLVGMRLALLDLAVRTVQLSDTHGNDCMGKVLEAAKKFEEFATDESQRK